MRTLVANSFHQIDSGDLVAGKRDLFANAVFYDCAFLGTLAPFFRASESPIAIACLRLFTAPPLPPFPERNVPFFLRRMALATVLPAALPYLRLLDFLCVFFLAIRFPPGPNSWQIRARLGVNVGCSGINL